MMILRLPSFLELRRSGVLVPELWAPDSGSSLSDNWAGEDSSSLVWEREGEGESGSFSGGASR